MHVTIGANCWNGQRRESLQGKTEMVPRVVENAPAAKWRIHPDIKGMLTFVLPISLLGGLPPVGITHALSAWDGAPEAVTAMAIPDGSKQMILHAFDPLINLIQALAYPIAGVMIAGGCLFIMVQQRERGMQMLQNAALGYLLVQLSPMMLKLLVGIGSNV